MLPDCPKTVNRSLFLFTLAFFAAIISVFHNFHQIKVTSAQENSIENSQTAIWKFFGKSSTSENYLDIPQDALRSKDTLRLTFDLNGTCFNPNESTEIVFDQPIGQSWKYVNLSKYAKNCFRGKQTVDIPLSDFRGLNRNKPVGKFHARFWHNNNFRVDFYNALVFNSKDHSIESINEYASNRHSQAFSKDRVIPSNSPSVSTSTSPDPTPLSSLTQTKPSPTPDASAGPNSSQAPTPTPLPSISQTSPTPTPSIQPSPSSSGSIEGKLNWAIQSVSSMKISKDMVCSQPDKLYIQKWVSKARELGANYIAVETPYDDPYCASALDFTNTWVQEIRNQGMHVWHRHMPLSFEGIYNVPKKTGFDNIKLISDYIQTHPLLFAPGDIFTPIPEVQNGGIAGITYCAQNVCQFNSKAEFNQWIRDAVEACEQAFKLIGLEGQVDVGYFGFDAFVAWGHNNPDWDGILEDSTISKMGEITIDHYPELVGTSMSTDLDQLHNKYPTTPIIIGEWGTVSGGDLKNQVQTDMQAAIRPYIVGFNYWHMGMGGFESLIKDDFSNNIQFSDVQSFFTPH